MKHTLGRWEARELFADDDEPQSLGLFVYAEHDAIAHRSPVASLPGLSPLDFANAHLIAAAPELLAALEWMTEAFGHYCEGDPSDDEVQALQRALRVINQAKGNS